MNLKPLGDRYLIRPITSPEQTASGLHLVEHKKPEQMGTVVAVGTPVHPLKAEGERVASHLRERYEECGHPDWLEDADVVTALVAREPCCKVGDTVLFSWTAGQELLLHDTDDRLLILPEQDLIAVIED